MNDAILKFHRYEDASLAYTGINRHTASTRIRLIDSTVSAEAVVGTVELSHLSEMLRRISEMVGMRGPYLCIPSLILSPHCAASPLVWC